MKEHPELAKLLIEGKVNLSNIAIASKSIKAKETKIEEIVGKSHREVQMLTTPASESKPKERIRPIVLTKKAPKNCAPSEKHELREERYEIKFSVTKEVYEEFQELRAELSNQLGSDLSFEAVFEKLLSAHKGKIIRKSSKKGRTDTRRIPVSVKREVTRRDGGQCTYVARDGTRCAEKRYLQFDHDIPYAVGGKSDANNLRLMCPAHNKLMAEEGFTKTYIKARMKAKCSTGSRVT